jgi:hypothetical protein
VIVPGWDITNLSKAISTMASNEVRPVGRRRVSQGTKPSSGGSMRNRAPQVTHADGYTYALRIALLMHLLSPRQRKPIPATPPPPPPKSTGSSIYDLLGELNPTREAKTQHATLQKPSTKMLLPSKYFFAELENRLKGVIMRTEKQPGFNDPLVNRTFGAFLNNYLEKGFRSSVEKSRRVEDLVLIFVTNSTRELQRNPPPIDGWVKEMVDRHVALFVRLVIWVLKDNGHAGDRPELMKRLQTLEAKLLAHDQSVADYASASGNAPSTVDVFLPLSYEVKDMPHVQLVGRLFGLTNTQLQSDLMKNKDIWTTKAALEDMKDYHSNLNFNTRKTLRSADFDIQEGYDAWRKQEQTEISQLISSLIHANPELAKSTGANINRPLGPQHRVSGSFDSGFADMNKGFSDQHDHDNPYVDMPVDMSTLRLVQDDQEEVPLTPYTFIPQDARHVYRFILNELLKRDLQEQSALNSSSADTPSDRPVLLLSKQSLELLDNIAVWWRLPYPTRMLVYMDVVYGQWKDGAFDVDVLEAAFSAIKNTTQSSKTPIQHPPRPDVLQDQSKWTISDFALNRQIIFGLHEALSRELYQAFQDAYGPQPPAVGPVLYFFEAHVLQDPVFEGKQNILEPTLDQVRQGLKKKAQDIYNELLDKDIPEALSDWEFAHVIKLAQDVKKFCDRMQKRYRKNADIEGVKPLTILLETMLTSYTHDAHNIIGRIMVYNGQKGTEPRIDDGFALYEELAEFRSIFLQALPGVLFPFSLEDLLESFVWRWIELTSTGITDMVDQAIKEDPFAVRVTEEELQKDPDRVPTDGERHSNSIIDLFALFKTTVKKIQDLNWDNDFQYAKFMTALANIIGAGVSRYCDGLENLFSLENNRLAPEQEMESAQSAQEKWIRLAKDAWNNKEKAEPFQFYPKSFVKLNNIEFALFELDKLEKVMNVTECAKVIKSNTPVFKRRAPTTFVFTVKIVDAENLQACDINGLSDPFVVLVDEYKTRLAKTRVIYGNLNPRWDESFDISTQRPLNIIATVWDWDRLGQYDVVGRTLVKLDPSQFSDYMPRDISQPLDTQGTLNFRVSMEGEKDDIEFYFGKAFRTLKRTERDMTRQITDKLTTYMSHCLSRNTLRNLLGRKYNLATVSTFFRNQGPVQTPAPTQADIEEALSPLFAYFHDNFSIMQQTLTSNAMIIVMSRLWKEVLLIIESLLVPPLSDKTSNQKALDQRELDIVFKWLNVSLTCTRNSNYLC